MSRAAHTQGFTLVEVMIAIGIMTVGSLGILSMHNAVTRANRDAREMNMAIAITETWMERVERDALGWNQPGLNTPEILATDYLLTIGNQADETPWFRPAYLPGPPEQSYGFDFFGNDTATADDIKYCVNLKMSWIRQGRSARVDVRTFWLREDHKTGAPSSSDWVAAGAFRGANCQSATADSWNLGDAPNVNVIFASTVITWTRRDAP